MYIKANEWNEKPK